MEVHQRIDSHQATEQRCSKENSTGIFPNNILLLALNTPMFIQEEILAGILPENLLLLISTLDKFLANLLGSALENEFPANITDTMSGDVQMLEGISPEK